MRWVTNSYHYSDKDAEAQNLSNLPQIIQGQSQDLKPRYLGIKFMVYTLTQSFQLHYLKRISKN